jgi:hypothetical protein
MEPTLKDVLGDSAASPTLGQVLVPEGTSSLVLYNDRIRISADVDLAGAKELMRKLQKHIDLLEEEKDVFQ